MADETQVTPEPSEPRAAPEANAAAADPFLAEFDRAFERPPSLAAKAPAAPLNAESGPDEPSDSEPPADSGDAPSTPGEGDPPPSRREKARQRDESALEEARRQGADAERARLEAERRTAEAEARLRDLEQRQQQAIQQGLAQLGTPEERERLYRALRTADPYSDEHEEARKRLDEMDAQAEVFQVQGTLAHRAVMGSAFRELLRIAEAGGVDPRTIDPNDANVTVGEHFARVHEAAVKAAVEKALGPVREEAAALREDNDALKAQLETMSAKLAGHAAELPAGGRSARVGGGRTVFDPNRSPQDNLGAAVDDLFAKAGGASNGRK